MLSVGDVAEAGTNPAANTRRPHTKGEITMSKIIAFVSVALDRVMQAPGRLHEDPRGDFTYGGWAARYANSTQKYLASTTLTEPLPWSNSTLSRHDTTAGPR